ncbi:GntR family transcriptional regulator [Geobacter sp. AOG2]|uniref:GntR family transcriptional regulator n=1 Tax=Geobacter sp. AOG2 TaxID=1566347 RepID=UPI001CC7D7F7|nr:GntR family transcriptional regulator [Geobacter sp. AOG2]GFE60199.1 hypothetical protein AOG2_07870 [Geobacter sp. AOG2]
MFILNNNGDIPLYKQLYNQIRERVLSGQMSADFKLPSVRDLADELSVSRNTVEAAYLMCGLDEQDKWPNARKEMAKRY